MGDIADDHYGYIHDDLERMECDPDYYTGRYGWGTHRGPAQGYFAPLRPAAALSDFDNLSDKPLPDDCSDLV